MHFCKQQKNLSFVIRKLKQFVHETWDLSLENRSWWIVETKDDGKIGKASKTWAIKSFREISLKRHRFVVHRFCVSSLATCRRVCFIHSHHLVMAFVPLLLEKYLHSSVNETRREHLRQIKNRKQIESNVSSTWQFQSKLSTCKVSWVATDWICSHWLFIVSAYLNGRSQSSSSSSSGARDAN